VYHNRCYLAPRSWSARRVPEVTTRNRSHSGKHEPKSHSPSLACPWNHANRNANGIATKRRDLNGYGIKTVKSIQEISSRMGPASDEVRSLERSLRDFFRKTERNLPDLQPKSDPAVRTLAW
jgi:hypothetical protein